MEWSQFLTIPPKSWQANLSCLLCVLPLSLWKQKENIHILLSFLKASSEWKEIHSFMKMILHISSMADNNCKLCGASSSAWLNALPLQYRPTLWEPRVFTMPDTVYHVVTTTVGTYRNYIFHVMRSLKALDSQNVMNVHGYRTLFKWPVTWKCNPSLMKYQTQAL